MQQYDLIAFDMDGTLLNSKKQISESSIKAIQEADRAGKTVVIATGRGMAEMREPLQLLPQVRYLIAVSGSLILDLKTGEKIYEKAMDEDAVIAIFDAVRDIDLMTHLLSEESVTQADQEKKMGYYGLGVYQDMFDKIAFNVPDIYRYFLESRIPVYKFNLHHHNMSDRDMTYKRLEALSLPVTYALSEFASLECSAAEVNKGEGLKKLCSRTGISLSRTIAVGDDYNDIDMLKAAGLSVAMGNANETVKKTASVCTADCDHDGCAEAIYRYLLAK